MRVFLLPLLLAACATVPSKPIVPSPLTCSGVYQQSGYALCHTAPHTAVTAGAETIISDANGWVVVGFDRDAALEQTIATATNAIHITLAPGDYDVQRINGLPTDQVTPTDPVLLARIARETEQKTIAYAIASNATGFAQGFIWPVTAPVSARFGGQRILNGEAKRPHYGVDLATPMGTPILAPGDGIVTLAEPALHFEGGLIFINHGQGLTTAYLHLSRLDVQAGQAVKQGDVIGASGATGRASGPHLCWRMTWRGRHLNPSLWVRTQP